MKRDEISYRAKSFFTRKTKVYGVRKMICAKCKNEMMLIILSEKLGNRVQVVYLYQCVACRRSKTIEVIEIKRDTDRIVITKSRMNVS